MVGDNMGCAQSDQHSQTAEGKCRDLGGVIRYYKDRSCAYFNSKEVANNFAQWLSLHGYVAGINNITYVVTFARPAATMSDGELAIYMADKQSTWGDRE